MTTRYELLITAITETNQMVLALAGLAALAVLAWFSLGWLPTWMQRIARPTYIASMLILFLATVIFIG